MTNKFSTDSAKDDRYQLNLLLNILSLSDGNMTVSLIANKLKVSFIDMLPIIDTLQQEKIIELI